MTKENIIEQHKELHDALDRLTACYISCNKKGLSNTSVIELIEWSYKQTKEPECYKE